MAKAICISLDMTEICLTNDDNSTTSYSLNGDGATLSLDEGKLAVEAQADPFGGTEAFRFSTTESEVQIIYLPGDGEADFIGITDTVEGIINGGSYDLNSFFVNLAIDGNELVITKKSNLN